MMQTWFIAVTLKTWQVKTICPAGWSEEEGEGTEVAAESGLDGFVVGVATGVNALKTGAVGVSPTATGEEYPSGVEACSVANRSEFGTGVGANRPQLKRKSAPAVSHSSLFFFRSQLNGFKIEFLARQYFCTITAAIRTVNFSMQGMIFAKAGHALHLCLN